MDNLPQAVRSADHQGINCATLGGNYIRTVDTPAETLDFYFGALHKPVRGEHSHSEQLRSLPKRDGSRTPLCASNFGCAAAMITVQVTEISNDKVHGTFFQLLPTPRMCARFPFFNMMNNRDDFGEVILRPAKVLTIRSDAHALSLDTRTISGTAAAARISPGRSVIPDRPRMDIRNSRTCMTSVQIAHLLSSSRQPFITAALSASYLSRPFTPKETAPISAMWNLIGRFNTAIQQGGTVTLDEHH